MSDDNYSSSASRRKLSQDTTTRRSEDREREYNRRPSAASVSGNSDSTTTAAQSTMATSGMIIPNTSTMEEEYIEVPYGRDARQSGSSMNDERETSRDRGPEPFTDPEPDSASEYASPLTPNSPAVGLSGLSARLKADDDDDIPSARSGDDYYDKASYGRNSANSDRSLNGYSNRMGGGRSSVPEDNEKMRRDYEFRIATMQTQISNLQRDLGDSQQYQPKLEDSEARVRNLEAELATMLRVRPIFTQIVTVW